MAEDKTKSTVAGDTTKSTVTINDENPKAEGTVLGTVTSDELGVTTKTSESTTNNAADSALNVVDSIQENNADNKSENQTPAPAHKPAKAPKGPVKAPANAPKETDTAEPWSDKVPVSEDDLIDELFYHGGIAKNVAKEMIEKLKSATDTELREAMINHIVWHIATGGPENKENGGKGKVLHKKDIIAALNKIL